MTQFGFIVRPQNIQYGENTALRVALPIECAQMLETATFLAKDDISNVETSDGILSFDYPAFAGSVAGLKEVARRLADDLCRNMGVYVVPC